MQNCPNLELGVGLGWRPELPDKRDFIYSASRVDKLDTALVIKPRSLPSGFLKATKTDQRMTSACVGHSTARHWQQERKLTARSPIDPYWKAREYRGWQGQDEGAYIRDAFKMLAAKGCTRDDLYPDTYANIFTAPSAKALDDADNRLPVSYYRLDSDDDGDRDQVRNRVLACLSSGHSMVGGVTCYDSFFSEQTLSTGLVRMPNFGTEREQGGHAMHFGGHDLNFTESEYGHKLTGLGVTDLPKEIVYAVQSWGPDYGYESTQLWFIPLDYVIDRMIADDFWTTRAK